MSTQNYNATAGAPLTRGKQEAVAIANAATNDVDVPCGGDSTLVVEVDMTGAVVGDLSVNVIPFEADNITVGPVTTDLSPESSRGPTLSGGHLYFYGKYDVTGLDKVRVRITNNNAAPQTITRGSWRLA